MRDNEILLTLVEAVAKLRDRAPENGKDGQDGKDGRDGKDGEQGQPGEPGPQGEPGRDGRDGVDGKDGAKGERGEQGPQGEKGETGERGPRGERGEKGEQGPQGERGQDGRDGVDGLSGQPGADGVGIERITQPYTDKAIIHFTDGTQKELTLPKGPRGQAGHVAYGSGGVLYSGWAQYFDTQYTDVSPFTLADGVTATLPNNAGSKIEDYLPQNVGPFYNPVTQKITPAKVGDYNILTVRFRGIATHINTSIDFGVDIGGTQGVIFRDVKVFPRGAGVIHDYAFVCPGFSLATFIANGGLIKVGAMGGDIEIYNIEYQFARVHSP